MFYIRIIIAVIKTCDNWPRLLANRILTRIGLGSLAPSVEMIYLKNGMHFTTGERRTLGGSDLFLIYELWANESYYIPGNIDFKIHETDTVVDVGANRGYFSCFAAHKAEKGKVFSFEPMPENFTILKRNLELNNIHNIVAEKYGCEFG
jgi:hypothetical protein